MTGPTVSVLGGGVTVVAEPVDSASSVCLAVGVRTGSRDESAAEAGYSHFLEHLLFRGTGRTDAREINARFDSMGGVVDAMTSRESTVLMARVAEEDSQVALDLLLEMVSDPTLTDVELEQRIILEELSMIEDDHGDRLGEALALQVHGDHPLGLPIAGTRDSVGSATRESLAAFHGRAYSKCNVFVAAAGAVKVEWLEEAVLIGTETLSEGSAPIRTAPGASAGTASHQDLPGEQVHIQIGCLGPGRESHDRHTLAVLSTILGESASSRLFTEIRERRGLAYDSGSFVSPAVGASEVGVYLATGVDTAEEAAGALGAELARFRDGGPDTEEVERAKRQMKARCLLGRESMTERATAAASAVLAGLTPLTTDQILERIDQVTVESVAELATTIFAPETLHSGSAGPGGDVATAALESARSGSLGS